MINRRHVQFLMAFSVLLVSASFIFCSKSCTAKNKIQLYKKGFTYQKLDKTIINRILGKSYKKGAKISLSKLRYLRITYIDFEGRTQLGEMIVNKRIAKKTLKVFRELYRIKYPIQRMKLIDEYDANDEKSMADNNSSAFNYRLISHTNRLSNHAKGIAIDINPKINPYVTSHGIEPANSKVYCERDTEKCKGKYREYMIHHGDKVYRIFKKYGFTWGGDWNHAKDYQHFEYL